MVSISKSSLKEERETELHPPVGLDAYLDEIGRFSLLSADEEKRLAQRAQEGEVEAMRRLVEANLRIVVKWAKQFLGSKMSLDDLIAEGNRGLIHAVSKFNWRLNYRFTTYATWWIESYIRMALRANTHLVHVPNYAIDELSAIKKARALFVQVCGLEPTPEDLAVHMGLSLDHIKDLWPYLQDECSLDERLSFSNEEEVTLAALLEDTGPSPEQQAYERERHRTLAYVLSTYLSEREADILSRRAGFGYYEGKSQTLLEISKVYGLSRERVRQIEERGLQKLRHPVILALLKEYKGEDL